MAPSNHQSLSAGRYLIERLRQLGLGHVFGIPGDYVLGFMHQIEESQLKLIGTTNELCAGYAADAYARIRGLGALCVTYAVGGLSAANAVACAYAEKSPLVVISGAPGVRERRKRSQVHHMVGAHDAQRRAFEPITAASAVIEDPLTAFREIDRVLATCLRRKQPVYIELPRDRVDMLPVRDHEPENDAERSDPDELAEAVAEIVSMLAAAKSPIIIAGIEVHRLGLTDQVLAFAEQHNIPICSTLLSKSVISEKHPLYAGTYVGALSRVGVVEFVEGSDCVISLGAPITDMDTGVFTSRLDPEKTINATSANIRIRHHSFEDVLLRDLVGSLEVASLPRYIRCMPARDNPLDLPWLVNTSVPLTTSRLFHKVNSVLSGDIAVIADPGDAMFGAIDLTVHQGTEFLSSAFYATLGWAVPASIGAQVARPGVRPLVLVGDGAFQMTGTELSTAVRLGLDPIVIVLNNKGYLTERFILEGKFNDIHEWQYHKLPELLGGGCGRLVTTEVEFDRALDEAIASPGKFYLINAILDSHDSSPALRRLGASLADTLK